MRRLYNFTCTLMYGILTSNIRRPLELRFVLSGMHLTRLNLCFRSDILEEACPLPPDKLCCARLWKPVNFLDGCFLRTSPSLAKLKPHRSITLLQRWSQADFIGVETSITFLGRTLNSRSSHICI
ncbi:hypothetical protein CY34DRAFT_330728 [Suillus luteus UH-Slu-Lm8-n1]|uniref:Uncharacterized protein n=1 Tax=Suillus luteus UH-Slu-Lm8-n1 TaxID=930992 RepID=A0A0D0AZ19_9AGAM|nr:hypothetical protein CY34DRAFT_330728 [Suillus luteus UH-Slu-Lm8-n1]